MTRSKPARFAAPLITLALVSFAPAAGADDASEMKPMMGKVLAAWGTLDPANAAMYYETRGNAVFFDLAPLKYTGWNSYAAGVKEIFAGFSALSMSMNDDLWVERHGDTAITAVTGRADVVHKGGAKESLDWRWTVVWGKKGNQWRIEHEHLSAPLPLPPDGAPPAGQ